MIAYEHLTVTDIRRPYMVHSPKGQQTTITRREQWGLSICTQGQISYILDGQVYTSDPTRAVLLPRGATYIVSPDKESYSQVVNFQCDGLETDKIQLLNLVDSAECARDCERLKNLFLYKEKRLKAFSVFYELLHKVIQSQPSRHSPLAPALRYLNKHYADPALSNHILAKEAGISEVYFRKLFLAQFHTTPRQYILNLRLKKAKQLLTDTSFSIGAIAEECGFSNLYHFSRAFKEKTGITPTQYAKNHKTYQI